MSKKTKRLHKRHRTNKRHKKSCRHTRRHLYRKKRQIVILPRSEGLPLFTPPEKKQIQQILVNKGNIQSGNMIPGMRDM